MSMTGPISNHVDDLGRLRPSSYARSSEEDDKNQTNDRGSDKQSQTSDGDFHDFENWSRLFLRTHQSSTSRVQAGGSLDLLIEVCLTTDRGIQMSTPLIRMQRALSVSWTRKPAKEVVSLMASSLLQ